MSDPVFRLTGNFIELEYAGVATKYVRRDMINSISSSPYRVCISITGTDGVKPTETMTFSNKEAQANFLARLITALSDQNQSQQVLTKVNRTLTECLQLITEKMKAFKEDVRAETNVTVEALKMMYEEIKEKIDAEKVAEVESVESVEEEPVEPDEKPEEKPDETPDDDSDSTFICDMFALIGGLSVSVFLGAVVNSTVRYFTGYHQPL
jgi:predicted transcriptional regulator